MATHWYRGAAQFWTEPCRTRRFFGACERGQRSKATGEPRMRDETGVSRVNAREQGSPEEITQQARADSQVHARRSVKIDNDMHAAS